MFPEKTACSQRKCEVEADLGALRAELEALQARKEECASPPPIDRRARGSQCCLGMTPETAILVGVPTYPENRWILKNYLATPCPYPSKIESLRKLV